MDKTSIIGVILGIIAVGVGMVFKGVSPLVLLNPAALLIIFVGTAGAVTIAFPTSEIKKLPSLFKIIFKESETMSYSQMIALFVNLATVARKEGILSLEGKMDEIDDLFLKNGLTFAIDGQSAEVIRDIMNEELDAMEERHQANAAMFTQAGTYAPTLGVLGAVVGLIAALGNMENIDALGQAISAAFVATLFGIFSGYILWHPFANKLKRKSKIELKMKRLIIEGVLSVQDGQSPALIEQKLVTFLPISEREKYFAEKENATNG